MDNTFILQLVISFIAGGSFIALLSLLAEKSNEKISGLILAFPSTVGLGFFFLAWTNSPQTVADIAPSTFIPLGISIFFPVVYIFSAHFYSRFKLSKITSIALTFVTSSIFWLILSLPIALFNFSNFTIGILGYFFFIILAHIVLHKNSLPSEKVPPIKYNIKQKTGRAIFMGIMITAIVLLGKIINPLWGGVFSMFPAAYSSTFMIFHWYYDPKNMLPLIKKIPIGSLSFLVYIIIAMYAFPAIGFISGTVLAYLGSLVTSFSIAKFFKN